MSANLYLLSMEKIGVINFFLSDITAPFFG